MDPLKPAEFLETENWDTFNPDMHGYLPPQHSDGGIEEPIRQFIQSTHDHDAVFIASSVVHDAPTMRLTIRGETFTTPLSSREATFLSSHLGDPTASRCSVPSSEVEIVGAASQQFLDKQKVAVLGKLKLAKAAPLVTTKLASLNFFKAGSHKLSTARINERHFATVIVILPATFATPAEIQVFGTHGLVRRHVKFPADLSRAVSTCAFYTDVSDTHIDVGAGCEIVYLVYHTLGSSRTGGPAQAYLRNAFCHWRHAIDTKQRSAPQVTVCILDHQPASARDFIRRDGLLLSHLAPLAKAYGFKMYLCQLWHRFTTKHSVYHYDEQYLYKVNTSLLSMSGNPDDEDCELDKLRTAGGVPVTDEALLDVVGDMLVTDKDLQTQLKKVVFKAESEIVGDLDHRWAPGGSRIYTQ
ncbi:hypothetical protein C8R46DRAFT_1034065 [Mycena filopes]|nr:hypothetical protein C8R46DRAFT_1034065 [Mycena filopes]